MKTIAKHISALILLIGSFSSCQKYTNTAPLYPPPPAGYYDEVSVGTVYNGNLIVAGDFTALYGNTKYIAQWNGSSWQGLGSGLAGTYPYYSPISIMTTYNSNLIVAGYLTDIGGQAVNQIAQWNGTSWQGLGSGITTGANNDGNINALEVYNGNLIVAGSFEYAGGSSAINLAEWNGTSWQTTLGGAYTKITLYSSGNNASISVLAVYNGNLVMGGSFDSLKGQNLSNLAQWNGTAWSSVGGRCNGQIYSLIPFNSNLIVLGYFDTIGGVAIGNAAQWNGTAWSSINLLSGPYNSRINAPLIYNGNLYCNYQYTNDSVVYQWSGSGSPAIMGYAANTKETWSDQDEIKTNIQPICVYNGSLIAGGWFTSVNGVNSSYNLIQWNGTSWIPF